VRAEAGVEAPRRGRSSRIGPERLPAVRRWSRLTFALLALVPVGAFAAGVLFAGSPDRIPAGVTVAGVPLSGLTAEQAREKLQRRAAAVRSVPMAFTGAGGRWSLTAEQLGIEVDWGAAVDEALAVAGGPTPIRGLRRVKVRLLGAELEPHATVYQPSLRFQIERMTRAIDVRARDASIVLRRLSPVTIPAEAGRELDRDAAADTIVAALASFSRRPVALPVVVDEPTVTARELSAAVASVRTALSAPVHFGYGDAHWSLPVRQLATFLELPADGRTQLRLGGRAWTSYVGELDRAIRRRPHDAEFRLTPNRRARVVAGMAGRAVDAAATADALLGAATSTSRRSAELVVRAVAPAFTTAEANALGVSRVVGTYFTYYSGTADRIRNLQLAVAAIDGTVIQPGKEFSFNRVVGPRTEERGYASAPVIVNGEYEEGVGGGVSQVATTVFNAVWEGGLRVTSRTAHALYISRYPLGRDATVNYPDVDLRFVNDTDHAVYVRGTYDDSGIRIAILGAPTGRRVVSKPGELEETGAPKAKLVPDPTLYVGQRFVEDDGEPSRSVTVIRTIYAGDEVLRRETWTTNYRYEAKIVHVGTKPKPAVEPKPKQPAATTTTTEKTTTTGKS
jgi:vancomycin resistance protein YoaR